MLVPVPVQQQIVAQAPLMAYAPSRLPSEWRFRSWFATGSMVEIVFKGPGGGEVDFFVTRQNGSCGAGAFGSSGGVYWNRTVARAYAWKCASGKKLVAELFPAKSLTQPALLRFVGSVRRLS